MSISNYAIFFHSYTDINDADLEQTITELNLRFANSGSKEMVAHLRIRGIHVKRERVRDQLRAIDPIGTAARWAKAIPRRTYHVASPNELWHVDTHHKLIR